MVWADDYLSRWSVGLLRVKQEWLNTGRNRDLRASLKAGRRDKNLWLWRDAELSENIPLHMPDTDREAAFGNMSGQGRLNELFRRAQGGRIGRNSVRTMVHSRRPVDGDRLSATRASMRCRDGGRLKVATWAM
ncbi:NaeI family type II restriction endonuclease [Streptomyces chartreusis]|uniref:NaeI family type II restriction endonuclease n=1 Tax=Streptomyces chartreusis TaxID=1969 RepID=UPI0036D0CD85